MTGRPRDMTTGISGADTAERQGGQPAPVSGHSPWRSPRTPIAAEEDRITYVPLTRSLAADVARLHSTCLTDFFLAGMGPGLLVRYYAHYYGRPDGVCLVARDATGRVVGIAAGARDYAAFLQDYYRANFIGLALGVMRSFWRGPGGVRESGLGLTRMWAGIRALLHVRRVQTAPETSPEESSPHTVELAALVVHPDFQGKGVARELFRLFEERAVAMGVWHLRSTVLAANARTIAFNRKVGLRPIKRLSRDIVFEKTLPMHEVAPMGLAVGDADDGERASVRAPHVTNGQPTACPGAPAQSPTDWLARPRVPAAGRPPYVLALTHDVDLLSVRELPWRSRTLRGHVFRCVLGNVARLLRRRISLRQYLHSLLSGVSVPLIKARILADPIEESFRKMLEIERRHGVRSTIFFIPEARNPGKIPRGAKAPTRRAADYCIEPLRKRLRSLEEEGWEIGVHGIDSYRDLEAARREFGMMSEMLGHRNIGHRSHWFYSKGIDSWDILRQAGYAYDASLGSNFIIGWPEGRKEPFRPFAGDAFTVLPLPVHDAPILDQAKMNLDPSEAWRRISALLRETKETSGVITVLWHTHSFSAPRYWGDLYEKIFLQARADGATIVPAKQAIALWRNSVEAKK